MWRKGHPCVLLMGMQIEAATWKTVWSFLKKLKIEQHYDPAVPILAIICKGNEITIPN